MKPNKIKRLAARILNVGETAVWMDPESLDKIREGMTKEDVRQLIRDGAIRKKGEAGQSKGRTRKLARQKKKGRKRGFGKRRGTAKARVQKKKNWMKRVRSQRSHLKELRKQKKVSAANYRQLYKRVSGGFFKGKKNIDQSIKG